MHRALTKKGIKPVQYATLIKKVDTIENLKSEEEKLGQQNLKIGEEIVTLKQEEGQLKRHNNELKHDNEWIQGQNADLMVENEKLKAENDFLEFQKTSLETTVNKNRIKIENLDKQKVTVIRLLCTLEAKVNQLALKRKQLDSTINISEANRDALCEKFIEDAEPYVIESIRDYAGQRMDNFTLVDLMDHPHDFGRVLHYWLKEPTGGLLETLIHPPSVSSTTITN